MALNLAVGARSLTQVALAVALALIANIALAQSTKGTATYRERMALPPGAVFEATIEDVSRADARAQTIARQRVESPGNPPIAFTIAYDPAKILQERRYVVRARILVDGKLLFTTDTAIGSGQVDPSNPPGKRPLEGAQRTAISSLTDGRRRDLRVRTDQEDQAITDDE